MDFTVTDSFAAAEADDRTYFWSLTPLERLAITEVLVIHGLADDFIPPSMGKAIFAAARQPKWLWLVPEANHNTVRAAAGSEFPERLVEFWRAGSNCCRRAR